MKPSPELVLNQAFARIAMELGPALPPGYGQGSATLMGVLLLMVAQEFNRAAEIRERENALMRNLFADVGPRTSDALRERLASAAGEPDTSINVAALDRANGELKRLLIELHSFAEQTNDRALELRILKLLSEGAAARQVFLPAM